VTFRLVDTEWDAELRHAVQAECASLYIVCPFIKRRAVARLLENGSPATIRVITRFNLGDFYEGVSDVEALRLLLERGAAIRGVRNLHAKLYLFGGNRVAVTSANLTDAALLRNHEFGFVSDDVDTVRGCQGYFDDLWRRAGKNLSETRLKVWEERLANSLVRTAPSATASGLGDEGVDAGASAEPIALPAWTGDAGQAFVKFFGEGDNRAEQTVRVIDEVNRSGCHWACTYPKGKRPRRVRDSAVMFMGCFVRDPNDIRVYGRAIGIQHRPGRDDATEADAIRRNWKAKWPHYVRVHHPEFVAGQLSDGISLYELMSRLGSSSFVGTQQNAATGKGNTDPHRAYLQQAAVELSPQGAHWLNERLEAAFVRCGRLAPATMEKLDWPNLPIEPGLGD